MTGQAMTGGPGLQEDKERNRMEAKIQVQGRTRKKTIEWYVQNRRWWENWRIPGIL